MDYLRKGSYPLKIIGIYIGIAAVWVIIGNYLFIPDIEIDLDLARMRTIESGLFILTSSSFLYVLLKQKINRIQSEVDQKQTLIQELHHRVRNNLAVIIGMMEIKSLDLEGQSCYPVLEELRQRTQSLASCQKLLHQYEDPNLIPMHEWMQQRLDTILTNRQVRDLLYVEIQNVHLNINQAIPFGFILTEILLFKKYKLTQGLNAQIWLMPKNGNSSLITFKTKISGIGSPSEFLKADDSHKLLEDPITQAYIRQLDGEWKLKIGADYVEIRFTFEKGRQPSTSALNHIEN